MILALLSRSGKIKIALINTDENQQVNPSFFATNAVDQHLT